MSVNRQRPLFTIVGTPIGNLGDLSKRAIESISEADIVFAEDTRTALNLLNHLSLKKRIISCHKDNERESISKIVSEIESGNRCVLISEAGMPCISDPGADVVRHLIKNDIRFEVVSGPTALIHGLINSGFSGGSFYFHGFLPHKDSEKVKIIESLKGIRAPIIFYESPHRVKDTIKLLLNAFPAPIAVSRELTKMFEETVFINLYEDIENITVKGEFVICVDNSGAQSEAKVEFDPSDIASKLAEQEFTAKDIVKVLKILGVKRNDAYNMTKNF